MDTIDFKHEEDIETALKILLRMSRTLSKIMQYGGKIENFISEKSFG